MVAARRIRLFDSEIHELSIAALTIKDDVLQSRARTDPEIVRIYSERRRGKPGAEGTPFPPVLVFRVGEELWLADGFHRVEAARKLGIESISAVIREGSLLDALVAGAEINMSKENLRGYQEADRKRYAELLIRCEAGNPGKGSWDWSDKEIGRRCGLSYAAVKSMRGRLFASENVPLPNRVRLLGGSKRWRTYGCSNSSPTISKSTRGYQASVGGENVRLSSDRSEAKEVLDRIVRRRENAAAKLVDASTLVQYLVARGVPAATVKRSDFALGGARIGDIYLCTMPEATAESALAAVGRCVLAQSVLSWPTRLIVAAYARDDGNSSRVANLAANMTPPVDFVVPEEIVEQLGRQARAAEASVAS